ncbi:MAG: hypothetical protein ACRD3T_06225 [Terriglobia bacterium]
MGRTSVFTCLMAGFVTLSVGAVRAQAQSAPYVQVGNGGSPVACPPDDNFASGMKCYSGTVLGCPYAEDLGITYGYEPPPTGVKLIGTIVLLPGAGGQIAASADENKYAGDYANAGYEVVELAWDSDWEDATNGMGPPPYAYNIEAAACRPATFLNYVFTKSTLLYSTGGRCTQGLSAGSGAVAYALAWYAAGAYLDKVELLSGPVFSDIDQGCEVPAAPNVTVCQASPSWCQLGTQPPWSQAPAYGGNPLNSVKVWTGDSTCVGSSNTTQQSEANWLAMSIVNANIPTLSYPNTNVTAWLCASVAGGGSMNNSSPQGQLFYEKIVTNSNLSVYAVQFCNGPEGVDGGTVPALNGEGGYDAILNDMTTMPNQCVKNPNH